MNYDFSHILGLSKIGVNRELKFELENYWNSDNLKLDDNIIKIRNSINKINWIKEIKYNLDYITVGDFSYYDHILENLLNLNSLPERFKKKFENFSEQYFFSAKGTENEKPMEMKKWFNTNYHYLVPEFGLNSNFLKNTTWLINDIKEAKILNFPIKVVLIGPLTLLKLGKIIDNNLKNRILLLPNILLNYIKIINELKLLNIKFIQIDEPILVLNISKIWLNLSYIIYSLLSLYFSNIILTTYFGEIKNSIKILSKLNLQLHVDIINNKNINYLLENFSKEKHISIGLIDGKNIWKNNLENSFYILNKFNKFENIFISTSCSLNYIPIDINLEDNINEDILKWISFGDQKLQELEILKNILNKKIKKLSKLFIKWIFYIENKKKSKLIFNKNLQNIIKNINNSDFFYREKYNLRKIEQEKILNLPILPTTTIGSFPQTNEIRKARNKFFKKLIEENEYDSIIKNEIDFIIKKQIEYNINVLVHGEIERNDMVEYYSEILNGFLSTKNGWVQSYGSRYVKPPIIFGDIFKKNINSLKWIKYAQSLTNRPVKGMLTGPITMFKWSYSRNDQPNYITSLQISIFLRNEVLSLEESNIKIIQIDEPAIREYLPLKADFYKLYFNWAIKVFLFSSNKINLNTQIHTHICYSEFKNIFKYIEKLDVDVISIESSRSNMNILPLLINYPNSIGLGIYDIHTKHKLNINSAIYLIKLILNHIFEKKIWINPDCGLKTRKWLEIDISIKNMIKATNLLRYEIEGK